MELFPEAVKKIEGKTFTALSNNDISSMTGRGWGDAFGTSERTESERSDCRTEGRRRSCGHGRLQGCSMGDGGKMWFNTMVGMHGKDLSLATKVDRTEIPEKLVKRCEESIKEESKQFKWEKGDVIFLDNFALLNGRRPALSPSQKSPGCYLQVASISNPLGPYGLKTTILFVYDHHL
ncbi:hypothetical protein Acr_27g0001950 [Actinidia rufa]|uniref:TauD/TfdA-like domain-containing protein n=1 Tax=Actinidia rufa TaxID=165716 RepID=A0A7J0H5T2_9ERIC|nr:hypothetical protein Acr_27g0001950 [Actinidia rufa]